MRRIQLHDSHALRSAIPDYSPHATHTCHSPAEEKRSCPTTPHAQRLPALTHTRFSLLRFRSPLLTEYLLLRVLRCFTSPRSPHHPMNSDDGNHTQLQLGSPIRKSSDQTLVRQLPEAYRRPQRPSSALGAKASTECPQKLNNKITQNKKTKDAHNHYTVHKQPTHHTTTPPHTAAQAVTWRHNAHHHRC